MALGFTYVLLLNYLVILPTVPVFARAVSGQVDPELRELVRLAVLQSYLVLAWYLIRLCVRLLVDIYRLRRRGYGWFV